MIPPMMISWAQQGEDVVLARAFAGQTTGFYVDIGAFDPQVMSVTKHFYDSGWSGINIEPYPPKFEELQRARPRDINLQVGLADTDGTRTLYVDPDRPGDATMVDAEAGRFPRQVTVPVTTLASVLEEHAGDRTIDFLKIDVEGYEREVIVGNDWSRWRPRALVVEATRPRSPEESHERWEPLLLDAGYELALFDGLNRFYACADEPELRRRLSVPANVHDDWKSWHVVQLEELLQKVWDGLQAYQAHAKTQDAEIQRLRAEVERLTQELAAANGARNKRRWWRR